MKLRIQSLSLILVCVIYLPSGVFAESLVPAEVAGTSDYLYKLKAALVAFKAEYGRFPNGTAIEICQVLSGKVIRSQNPRKIEFHLFREPTGHLWWKKPGDLNAAGEPIDRWEQPLIFSYPKPGVIMISSLGPPKRPGWTSGMSVVIP
ncbi:MAG: hypothetical protein GXX91_07055 [Verrucomicrobiaceae bacterium]|nr:hypothetical protein [Verrucomicrobiaceae bacterium]